MNIQHLIRRISNLITNREREIRKQRLGIAPFNPVPSGNNVQYLIQTNVIEPIVRELCSTTKENITYQVGLATGYYKLLINGKSFVIVYIPNLTASKVYVKFLNHNERQCAKSVPLIDTNQIVDYLETYNNSCDK
ncbi:hypothetical protein [Bacteroides cellulosilyticus]|uniref:hypothetical protein n=1 Tax=Bacteroides cellulosilyticus TaxID=246787 RepID=UPI003563836B